MKKQHSSTQNMHTNSPTQGKIRTTTTRASSKAVHPTAGGSEGPGMCANSAYGARRMAKKA